MPIVYSADVPKFETPFNETQNDILNNFNAIPELISINHISFGVNNSGFHSFLTMPNTTTPTIPEPVGVNMYVKDTGLTSEIFGQYPNGNEFQLSGISAASSGSGFSKFASGVIMKWGTVSSTNGIFDIVYPVGIGIPAFKESPVFVKATVLNVVAGNGWNIISSVNNASSAQFIDTRSENADVMLSASISYLAIGI